MMRAYRRSSFLALYTILSLAACGTAFAQALQSGTGVQFNLPVQNFVSNYYIDVDASAAQLTINVNANGGDVDLYVRYATPFPAPNDATFPTSPQAVSSDTLNRWSQYHSYSAVSAESISVLRSSRVPLAAGRWYISVINTSNATAAATTLTATTYATPQLASIAVDFSNPSTNADPTLACETTPWTDATPVAPVGGNPGTTLGQQRQNALKYAVSQLTQTEQPPVPITIHACWAHLGGDANRAIIAHASPVTFLVDEPNFGGYVLPLRYTWYAITEAVRLGGASQCGLIGGPCGGTNNEEIEATFNEDIGTAGVIGAEPFYYGYTPAVGGGPSIDFVSVAMHEITHGLGFLGLANVDDTTGPVGAKAGIDASGSSIGYEDLSQGPYDDIYDVNAAIVNTITKDWVPFMGYEVNGAGDAARAASLISNNGLRWSEATAVDSTVNQLKALAAPQSFPLLYAPNPISSGSTLSHTAQAGDLMNASYNASRAMGLAAPMLAPLGWSLTAAPAAAFAEPFPSNWFDRSHGGHGIDFQLARHDPIYGDVYILVFYTYDANGYPEWYLATGNVIDGVFVAGLDGNSNSLLYSTYGNNHGVGKLSLTQTNIPASVIVDFNQAANSPVCRDTDRTGAPLLAVMNWRIGNDSGNWCMEPLVTTAQHATPDYNGHWFAPVDGGWGMEFLNFNGDASSSSLFVLMYYPDAAGLPAWAVASGSLVNGTANLELLARANGYCRTCTAPATTQTTSLGTLTLHLTPPATNGAAPNGTASFTINYPGGGSFSRTNDAITTLSLPAGQ